MRPPRLPDSFRRAANLGVLLGAALFPSGVQGAPETGVPDPKEVRAAVEEILAYRPQVRVSSAGAKEIELGRWLFFDSRLSRTNTVSCATCHRPERSWTDGLPRAKGVEAAQGPRNTPSLMAAAYYPKLGWDGSSGGLEQSARRAIESPREMDQPLDDLPAKLSRAPRYVERFAELYGPGPVASGRVLGALAAFAATLQAPENSPFDRFVKDAEALSPSAQRGLVLYAGKGGCRNCHVSRTFTDNRFRNILGGPAVPGDAGRFVIEPESRNWGAFRTPTLRNVALTAPYMHDGSIGTLGEVIDFYDRAGPARNRDPDLPRWIGLTAREKGDLLEFLKSLTSSMGPPELAPLPALHPGGGGGSKAPGEGGNVRPPAPAGMPGEFAARADGLLSTAELLMSELDAFIISIGRRRTPSEADGRYCPPARSRAYCWRSPVALRVISSDDMKMAEACEALEAGDPGLCRRSEGSLNHQDDCLSVFWNLKLAQSLMRGGDGDSAVCRRWIEAESLSVDSAALEAGCDGLKGEARAEPHCRSSATRFPGGFADVRRCMEAFGVIKGEGCSKYPQSNYRGALCPSIAAYREAFFTAEISRCGDLYLCRLLMGEAGVCDARMKLWKAGICGGAEGVLSSSLPAAGGPPDDLCGLMESAVLRTGGFVLGPGESAAVDRLHGMLIGTEPLDGKKAAADIFLLRSVQLDETLARVEALNLPEFLAEGAARLRSKLRAAQERFHLMRESSP